MKPAVATPMGRPDVPGVWRLTLMQPPDGYRFALDAFLLADFASPPGSEPVIEFGVGCGVITLLLARRFPRAHFVGVELQPELARAAGHNVVQNGLSGQVDILLADICDLPALFVPGAFGAVIGNPPYRPVGRGRLNPNPAKAVARHEVAVTLSQWLDAARHGLKPRGGLTLVYHPSRLAELCAGLDRGGLRPRRMRLVHPKPGAPASMILVEAVKGGRDALTVLAPLMICDLSGAYSPEMQAIFQGRSLQTRGDTA